MNLTRLVLKVQVLLFNRSYGSVYKAMHKESGQVVAIKQVPVETDLQEIIKEISMMQQCDRFVTLSNFSFNFKNNGNPVLKWV